MFCRPNQHSVQSWSSAGNLFYFLSIINKGDFHSYFHFHKVFCLRLHQGFFSVRMDCRERTEGTDHGLNTSSCLFITFEDDQHQGVVPTKTLQTISPLVQKTLIKLACVVSTGPLRLTMISFHCFEVDAMVSGTKREGEDSLWPEKFCFSPLSIRYFADIRSFVLKINPLECASSFTLGMFYRCSNS